MTEHTPTPWTKNNKGEIGPRFRSDDQSDGMLDPVAEVMFGDNREANAAFIVEAVNNHEDLKARVKELEEFLRELQTRRTRYVRGENIDWSVTDDELRLLLAKGEPNG